MAREDAEILVCHGQQYIFNQPVHFFYPYGNTPPFYLLKDLPKPASGASRTGSVGASSSDGPKAQASLLLLGCGDLRDLFHTLTLEDRAGCLPNFSLHAVAVDNEPAVFSRALLLLQLILDAGTIAEQSPAGGGKASLRDLWSVMYHHVITPAQLRLVREAAKKLLQVVTTKEAWDTYPLGRIVDFGSPSTSTAVGEILKSYVQGSLPSSAAFKKTRMDVYNQVESKGPKGEERGVYLRIPQSAATSEAVTHKMELHAAKEKYWQTGELQLAGAAERRGEDRVPNPLMIFTGGAGSRYSVHYDASPLEGFNLDRSYLKLAGVPNGRGTWVERATASVLEDFEAWTRTLSHLVNAPQEGPTSAYHASLRLVMVVADAVHFCETLVAAIPLPPAARVVSHLPPDSVAPLVLEMSTIPSAFDIIHCSNLADHVGTINLLLPLPSLLRPCSYASIVTGYIATVTPGRSAREVASYLTGLDPTTFSLFLDLLPTDWLVGATVHNFEGSIRLSDAMNNATGAHNGVELAIVWRLASCLASGLDEASLPGPLDGQRYTMSPKDFAACALPPVKICLSHYDQETNWQRIQGNAKMAREVLGSAGLPLHTPLSWLKLLAHAKKKLDLTPEHFVAAIEAFETCGAFIVAGNLSQELFVWAHLLGIYTSPGLLLDGYQGAMVLSHPHRSLEFLRPGLPSICRVALLVPPTVLSEHLLRTEGRERSLPRTATPPLEGYIGSTTADNRYHTVSCTCVVALRGARPEGSQEGWVCLREGDLYVRPAEWDQDPSAELLVTWFAPTFALALAPPTQLELGAAITSTLTTCMYGQRLLGPQLLVFTAPLSDTKHTAVLYSFTAASPFLTSTVIHTKRSMSPIRPEHGGVKCQQPKVRAAASGWEVSCQIELKGSEEKDQLQKCKAPTIEAHGPGIVQLSVGSLCVRLRLPFPVNTAAASVSSWSSRCQQVADQDRRTPHSSDAMLLRKPEVVLHTCGRRFFLVSPLRRCQSSTGLPTTTFSTLWHGGLAMSEEETMQRPGDVGSRPLLVEYKDSQHSIFARVMGQKTPGQPKLKMSKVMFCLAIPPQNVNMLIRVNALRLDLTNTSLVLDCCVCPLTQANAVVVGTAQQQRTESVLIKVAESELSLWKQVVALGVERARQWQHAPSCCVVAGTTKSSKASWPLPGWNREGGHAMCACGVGRDLPQDFLELMPPEAACHFYRAALPVLLPPSQVTPMQSQAASQAEQTPVMEQFFGWLKSAGTLDEAKKFLGELGGDLPNMEAFLSQMQGMDMGQAGGGASGRSGEGTVARPASAGPAAATPPPATGGCKRACAACGITDGNTGLKSCGRCHKVWYCGQVCQRTDWATHKKRCGAKK